MNEHLHQRIAELEAQLAEATARAERVEGELVTLRFACSRENEEICQTLGRALGYPKFADDQAAFSGATEADGVCVGPHVAATLAMEAAERIERLAAERDAAKAAIPGRCPITNLPFFMVIEHEDLGLVPTYGGPYDSYTIPELEGVPKGTPLHERDLVRWQFDHDEGCWTEAEVIPVRLILEADLIEVQEDLEVRLKERGELHRDRARRKLRLDRFDAPEGDEESFQ